MRLDRLEGRRGRVLPGRAVESEGHQPDFLERGELVHGSGSDRAGWVVWAIRDHATAGDEGPPCPSSGSTDESTLDLGSRSVQLPVHHTPDLPDGAVSIAALALVQGVG